VSFHTPGHKGRVDQFELAGFDGIYGNIIKHDISELPGADSLNCPVGCIRETMLNYAAAYGVKRTELLVNGSSSGLIAAIMSCVPRGGKLILGRNSHQAAFSALRMGGIQPIYLRPEINEELGLQTCITADEVSAACDSYLDAGAVLITSPNYFGFLSDIEEIAKIAHEHDMFLIVDQTHGAHLSFFDYEDETYNGKNYARKMLAAENQGADIVINGISESLFGLTGGGILNICTDAVDEDLLAENLRMLQAADASYILLASLDVNDIIMRKWGIKLVHAWKRDIEWLFAKAEHITGLTLVKAGRLVDYTRLNISMAELGISGEQLDRELRSRGIIAEMVHGDYVLLVTGAGSRRSDYEALAEALQEISENYIFSRSEIAHTEGFSDFIMGATDVPTKREAVPLYHADGRVVYSPITIYPPGSAIVCPGEILNAEVLSYIARAVANGDKISGVDEEGYVYVGAES